MEESQQEKREGDSEQKRQTATVPPTILDRRQPGSQELYNARDWQPPESSTRLTTMLQQIKIYFGKRTSHDDLDALSFGLRHLFHRVDFLYCYALPGLNQRVASQQGDYNQEVIQRQRIWLQLQTINRTLDRMAPLCHLLSDTIECLLDTLDDEEIWLRTLDNEDTVQLEQVKVLRVSDSKPGAIEPTNSQREPAISVEGWEQAINALMDQLLLWQEQHHKLASFPQQFARALPLECNLQDLDTAFAMLLDSAGAIFGDILPNFRLVKPDDREEIGALLFDLMQQSDQMLAQFEITLEPFNRLIRHFAVVGENT